MIFPFAGVTGHVKDTFENPMKNATVKLLHNSRLIPIHPRTGYFAVTLIPGSYIFSCELIHPRI